MKKIKYLELLPITFIILIFYYFAMNLDKLYKIWLVFTPILYGLAIAYLINPLIVFIAKKFNIGWYLSVFIGYIILFVIIYLLSIIIIPPLIDNLSDFVSTGIPNLSNNLSRLISDLENHLRSDNLLGSLLENIKTTNLISKLSNYSTDALKGLSEGVLSFTSIIIRSLISLIISIYILLKKDKYINHFHRFSLVLISDSNRENLYRILNKANKYFSQFLVGKIIDSLIIGFICFIGMVILKLPYALIISIIIGVTNIIPYFGPFIGAIPSAIIILLINPLQAIWFIIFIFLLQQFDGYILGPKILGDSIGVSPLWIIIGVIIGGGLMGPIGMIIGVPLCALIKSELLYFLEKREAKLNKTTKSIS